MFSIQLSPSNKMGLFATLAVIVFLAEAIVGIYAGFRPTTVFWVVLTQVVVASAVVAWIDETYFMGYFFGLMMIVGAISCFMGGRHLQWKEAIIFVAAIAGSQWGTYHFRIRRNRLRAHRG